MATTNIKLNKVIVLLVVFAVFSILFRVWFQQGEGIPSGDQVWSIKQSINLYAKGAGASVQISPPYNTKQAGIFEQKFLHHGMRLRLAKNEKNSRDMVFVAPKVGHYKIEMIYAIHLSLIKKSFTPVVQQSDLKRSQWLLSSPGVPVETTGVALLLDAIQKDNPDADNLLESIFNYIAESIQISDTGADHGGEVIEKRIGSLLGVNHAFIALLRAARLPARLVTGLNLTLNQEKQPVHWVEVYHDNQWLPMDVVGIHFAELPSYFIPLKKGGSSLVDAKSAEVKSINWQITQIPAHQGELFSRSAPSVKDILDLTRLEPNVRMVLLILLLLPLGVLVTEVLRHVVGIRTYGTFTPTLLALGAVFVDWLAAAITFSIVTLLGVLGRSALNGMGLSRVARLSVVFTLVVFIMTLVVSILAYYQPGADVGIVLLPIVILTTLVDRVYTVMDENGLAVALIRLGWTVAAAFLSIFVLIQEELGDWIVRYPEIHAVTVALIILLGRYNGSQLLDLAWLRWMKELPDKKPKIKSKNVTADEQAGQ